ncbi:MAG: S46 family peptidase, partial [Bacteroidota bacterium]
MIKKTTVLVFVFLLAIARPGKADEGMWLPFLINDMLYERMEEMGLELTREQIFSFNESSIKDAIVSFGGGCTAEIISDQGLLLTNHHCGYGRIQYHSTPENDILTDGFWAMNLEEELPNPGLFVRFLVAVEDVTAE